MPNVLDATGLTTSTQAELVTKFQTRMQAIYGADINLDPDSPDGQKMMIFIQIVLDNLDLLTQVYNSFDPDQALGITLDQRVAYNGIQRQKGTFTITPISITVSKALTLYGLDQEIEDIYTVSDNAGNQWQLVNTQSPSGAGTSIYNFQSSVAGARTTLLNTITAPVTIILGVTTINNPTTYITLGIDEESDNDLKDRRRKSVALGSQGYYDGLIAALENITGIGDAFVIENKTGTTDGDGIPSHAIWVIVSGSAAAADIAFAIYKKRNSAAGMKGAESYVITQADGSFFIVNWDVVTVENLFIKVTLTSLDVVTLPDIAGIRAGLPISFTPGVFEKVNINDLATAIQVIDNNSLVTNEGFFTDENGPFVNTLTPSSKDKQFSVSSANIILLPMQIAPLDSLVASLGTVNFSALGGFSTLVFSIEIDNSGGSIDSGTGVFTAGAGTGTDTIRATDTLGNFAETTVVVS